MSIQGYPYAGWYNGNVAMMIKNGTYADFREKILHQQSRGLYKPEQVAVWDNEWESIPLEERQRRRNVVVEDSTPVEKIIQTPKGPVRVIVSKPDENNNAEVRRRNADAPRKVKTRAKGLLTNENNPLLKQKVPTSSQSE